MSKAPSPLVELGKIERPHGFRGELIVSTYSGKDCGLAYLKEIFVGKSSEGATSVRLLDASWMPRGWKLKLEGVETDTAVKTLKGLHVYARRDALKELPPGEFYIVDLIGAEAIDCRTGKSLGKLVEVENTARGKGADVWWIEREGERTAVPATKRHIEKIDSGARKIWIKKLQEIE